MMHSMHSEHREAVARRVRELASEAVENVRLLALEVNRRLATNGLGVDDALSMEAEARRAVELLRTVRILEETP